MKTLLLLFISLLSITHSYATPAQVIIIRHGEKNAEGLLSQKGLERAEALVPFLTQTDYLLKAGQLFAIFAAKPVDTPPATTIRCIETMIPTSNALKIPLQSPFGQGQEKQMANLILNNEEYDGKNIVICWNHFTISRLIKYFGYPKIGTFKDCCYDYVFLLTFPVSGKVQITHQNLLFGDPDGTCRRGGCPIPLNK